MVPRRAGGSALLGRRLVVLALLGHDHDGARGVVQHGLARGAQQQAAETAPPARAHDDEVGRRGELREELGTRAVEDDALDREPGVLRLVAVDDDVQPLGDVGQHLLVVDRRRQPREETRTGTDGHTGHRDELGVPGAGLTDRVPQRDLGGRRPVHPDDDPAQVPHRRQLLRATLVVLPARAVRHDDRRAVRVRGQRRGDGAEQPLGEAAAPPRADDDERVLARHLDEDPRGVAGRDRRRRADPGALGAGASLFQDGARALLDGRVVEGRVAAVERRRRERRQRVGAHDVEGPPHAQRVRRGPVQGVEARRRAVDTDEDGFRAGHERLSSRRPGAIGRPT